MVFGRPPLRTLPRAGDVRQPVVERRSSDPLVFPFGQRLNGVQLLEAGEPVLVRVPTTFVQKYTVRVRRGGSSSSNAEQPPDQPRRPPEGPGRPAPLEVERRVRQVELNDQGSLPGAPRFAAAPRPRSSAPRARGASRVRSEIQGRAPHVSRALRPARKAPEGLRLSPCSVFLHECGRYPPLGGRAATGRPGRDRGRLLNPGTPGERDTG